MVALGAVALQWEGKYKNRSSMGIVVRKFPLPNLRQRKIAPGHMIEEPRGRLLSRSGYEAYGVTRDLLAVRQYE